MKWDYFVRAGWWRALTLAALVGFWYTPVQAEVLLASITEAKGTGAPAATSFKNGLLMAIEEVNGGGGVLGQKLVLRAQDIDTNAEEATEAARKAVADKPFAILGPVFSSMTLAAMGPTTNSGIPHFTGGEAASLTRKFHPTLMRSSLSQHGSVPRLAALAGFGLNARKVGVISVENDFGRDGRSVLIGVFKRRNVQVAQDLTIQPGQKDFQEAVSAVKTAGLDALVIYVNEAEAIGLLTELKRQGFDRPIVSDGLVAAQKVIDGAGGAAEGVLVHMNASVDVATESMKGFVARYQSRYGTRPDQNSLKGYFDVQLIKAGLDKVGKVDQAAFLKLLKETSLDSKAFPNLFSTVSYDFFGDLNRDSYFAVIRDNRPKLVATIRSSEGGQVELTSGRIVTLNSNEFRSELTGSLQSASSTSASKPSK